MLFRSSMILRYCVKKSMFKDGLHLLIPEIMLSRDQKKFLNERILSAIKKSDIFEDVIFMNDEHDPILDMASSHVPVFFIGSIKPNKEKRNAYPLSFVWQVESDEDGDINMTKINLKKVSK